MEIILGGAIALLSTIITSIIQFRLGVQADILRRKNEYVVKERENYKEQLVKLLDEAIKNGVSSNFIFLDNYKNAEETISIEDFQNARICLLRMSQYLSDISKLHIAFTKTRNLIAILDDEGPEDWEMVDLDGFDKARHYKRLQEHQGEAMFFNGAHIHTLAPFTWESF